MKLSPNLRITTVIALYALALSLALSPVALFAAEARPQGERGTIKSVDAEAHTLVVTDRLDNREHKFKWNDQTKFNERGKTATAADLKAGERVRVTYMGSGDLPTLQRVQIAPARTEKPTNAKS